MVALAALAQNNVAEEVAWVIGDEPIFKSDIEEQYQQALYERVAIDGNPYCVIPEQMALDKLFLDQARIDTVEVQQSSISSEVENRINFFIANLGSKEKVEEYFRMPLPRLREKLNEVYSEQYCIQQVQSELTKNVKATPADVRKFYNNISKDSLPYIPLQVETQIITINPVIPQQEIDEVKARLRDYAQQVNSGEREFSTLAILYSQDQSTAVYGGETGFQSRSVLLPEYATAAFNLNDSKRVSNIVETDDGFHIIQLIEKRGDRVNTRHILLRPKVSDKDLIDAVTRLDSVRSDIVAGKKTFDEMALFISQDKDSRNNNGNMLNEKSHSSRFEMADLPAEVGKKVSTMQPGDISEPFVMINPKTRREQVAIVKLVKRIDGHKADLAEDYMIIKEMCEAAEKEKIIHDWVVQKQKSVYVYIEEGWRNCEFKYDWLRNQNKP
ncbi:MAG: peptidylprolyl isomerase [Muribaculaceae bacterium]|nr:peptidylprolyl isomerase [Muribaculaceae bacterium]MBQ7204982.1 peptidylprolyl isomerase [Muribaculaceae bacterium]